MSTQTTRFADMSKKDDFDDISLRCAAGCHAPPVGIYHVPYASIGWANQVQALCAMHFLQAEGETYIRLLVDLTDGEFGRWLHGR